MKRSELPDEVFGIPEERKYPMPDKRHTLSAIKLFGHVEPKYEEELAKNIIKNMKKYNIPESAVGKDNKLRKYIDKYYNESAEVVEERYLINDKDIYYNKDKFDSGEINLCFITGHSGSGKSTMGRNMQSDNIEHYELDDLQCIKDHFTMQNLKEYGDLIYSYFNGQGKRFYVTYQDLKDNNTPGSEYEDILFKDFVHYAMKYAKSHKNRKYVIEGVWLYCDDDNGNPWFTPEEFKDYAFYIKGTSVIISRHRAALRDAREDSKGNKINTIKIYLNMIRKNWKWYLVDEKALNKFRKYFSGLMQTNESSILESSADEYERVEVPLTEEVLIEAANDAARHTKWCKMESFPFCSVHELQSCLVSVKDASFAFATFDGSEKDLNYVINSCNRNSTFRYGKYEVSCIPNSQGTKYLCGKITELYEYVKKSILTEETRLDNAPSSMYHLSTENHDGDVFEPRYYDNDNVKAGTERRVKRICFSDSINGCIYSIFPSGAYDVDLYVHIPGSEVTKVYETTQDDIYDSKITHELWVKEPVTMKCIGKIHISGVYKDKVKVLEADKDKTGYGKRKYYEPRWNWVEKINEATAPSSEYSMKPLKPEQMKEYYKWFKVVFNGTKGSITEKETKSTKVIYYNNEIIGYVAFSRYKDGNERYLGLGNFMIIPKYQRSGHGANVVKYIIDKYKDTYDLIYCWVDRSNTNTVNFYKKIAKVNMNTQSNPDQYYVEFYRKGKKSMNEFSVGAGPVVGIGSNPEPIYIVNYMQNNVFSGATQERFGICKTGMKDLHTFGGKYNRLHYTNLEEFEKEASNIKVYRYTGPLSDKYPSIYSIIEDADTDLDFYRLLTGNEIDNRSSIKYDPYFQRESYINDELSAITECVVAGVKEIDNKYEIPMIGLNEDGRVYNYYRDLDGVYIKNEVTNMRSGSYDDINDIPEEVNNLVIKGVY